MASAKYLTPYILITAFQYVFAKAALTYASPLVYGTLTALVATVSLFIITRGRLVFNRDTMLFSVFYWSSGVTWLLGLNYISPSQSAVLSFTMPLFVIPLSIYFLGERASKVEALGAVIGFSGIIIYNLPLLGGHVTLLGVGLSLADAFFWGLFSVYMRKLRLQDSGGMLVTASFVSFLLYGVLSATDFSIRPSVNLLFDVGYLGFIAGGINFSLWMILIRVEKLVNLTTLLFIIPVVTLTYGVISTGVLPSYLTLGGVGLIFVGIYTASILGRRGAAPEPAVVEPGPML